MKKFFAVLVFAFAACGTSAAGEQPFRDVPPGHWAAEAVRSLKESGVVKGYLDGTFRGDKVVTRYELAVLLVRFTEFFTETLSHAKENTRANSDRPKDTASALGRLEAVSKKEEPAKILLSRGFIDQSSPLLKEPDKPATMEEVADALACISMRLIELSVPAGGSEADGAPQADNQETLSPKGQD